MLYMRPDDDSMSDDVSQLDDIDFSRNNSPARKFRKVRKECFTPSPYKQYTPVSKDAPRLSKAHNSSDKQAKVTELKEKWAKEKEAKLTSMNDRRSALQRFVTEASQNEAVIRKLRLRMHDDDKIMEYQSDKKILDCTAADKAAQAAETVRIASEKRKHNLMLNKEVMRQFHEKEAELEIAMKEEEAELLAARRLDSMGAREDKTAAEHERRLKLFAGGLIAQEQGDIDVAINKAKHEEDVDIIQFRRDLALHKALKEKLDDDERRQDLVNRGEDAADGRKIDQYLDKERRDEERDIVEFRREIALNKADRTKQNSNEERNNIDLNGVAAREDRIVDQQMERAPQEENRDILDFRRDLALHKAQLDRESRLESQQIMFSNGLIAEENRGIDRKMDQARLEECIDIIEFRRDLALHKAEREKMERQERKEHMILKGDISQNDRKIDQMLDRKRQDEERDIIDFRRDLGLHKAQVKINERAEKQQNLYINGLAVQDGKIIDQLAERTRLNESTDITNFRQELALQNAQTEMIDKLNEQNEMIHQGEAAPDNRKIDQLLSAKRLDEDRGITEFRRETAIAKAAEDRADNIAQKQISVTDGLVAQENRKLDLLLEKARQDEDKDIMHLHSDTAMAKSAKDKADTEAIKQDFILEGEIAQGSRKVKQMTAKTRQEEDRDVSNFRCEIARNKAEKNKEDRLKEQKDAFANGVTAQGARMVDQQMDKERQEEDVDVFEFRRKLALHKAQIENDTRDALKQEMIKGGEATAGDKKIDQIIALEREAAEKDIMNFRREVALCAAHERVNLNAERRETMFNKGDFAREGKKIDQLLEKYRIEEDIDILDFRRDTAIAKAARDKTESIAQKQILVTDGLISQEDSRIDQHLGKVRQEEDSDIVRFRYQLSLAREAKEKADSDEVNQRIKSRRESAVSYRKIDLFISKAREEEDKDVLKFRRELSIAKAAKQKADSLQEYQIRLLDSEAAQENRKIDLLLLKSRQDEDRDILDFRHEIALHKTAQGKTEMDILRQGYHDRGLMAMDDSKIDKIVARTREEEDRDILQFRHELSLAKAAKEKEEEIALKQILETNALVAVNDREIDLLISKQRQDEDSNILNFRRELSKAKAAKEYADKEDRKQDAVTRGGISQLDRKIDLQITLERQQEDRDILIYRQESAVAKAKQVQEAGADLREEMFLKGAVARDDRQMDLLLEKMRQEEDRDIVAYRRDTSMANSMRKREEVKEQRESLAERLTAWRTNKVFDTEVQHEKDSAERKQGWIDVAEGKKKDGQFNTESLNFRLGEWRRQKHLVRIEQAEKAEAEAYENELKQQEVEDVKAYHATMKANNRESLSFRLDRARKDKDYDKSMKALEAVVADEDRRLADLDRGDVANYRKSLLDARRQSLIFRGQLEVEDKKRVAGEKVSAKISEAEQRSKRDEDWKSVKAAQEEQRAVARKELAEKLAYERTQRELEIQIHHRSLAAIHDELQRKYCNWWDEQLGKEEAKHRRRRSTAIRLESWRIERMYEEKIKAQQEVFADEEARQREHDREDLLYAKKMIAMNSKMDRMKRPFIFKH